MMVAILFCGLTAVSMSSCGDDDNNDGNGGGGKGAPAGMKVKYIVGVDTISTLEACDVRVEYTDANGKQTKSLTSMDKFNPDPFIIKGLPNEAELTIVAEPKEDLTAEKYDVCVTFGIGACAVDANGNELGTLGIKVENIVNKGIRTKRTISRTKVVTIDADGKVDVK